MNQCEVGLLGPLQMLLEGESSGSDLARHAYITESDIAQRARTIQKWCRYVNDIMDEALGFGQNSYDKIHLKL